MNISLVVFFNFLYHAFFDGPFQLSKGAINADGAFPLERFQVHERFAPALRLEVFGNHLVQRLSPASRRDDRTERRGQNDGRAWNPQN
jgi:hypothetical protein